MLVCDPIRGQDTVQTGWLWRRKPTSSSVSPGRSLIDTSQCPDSRTDGWGPRLLWDLTYLVLYGAAGSLGDAKSQQDHG